MAQIGLGEFVDNCEDAGIAVNGSLYSNFGYKEQGFEYPDDWTRSIARAGSILSRDPTMALVDHEIPVDFLGEYPTTAQLAMRGILNTSLIGLWIARRGQL